LNNRSAAILERFGVELDMKFPTDDTAVTGTEDVEQELVLDEESLIPKATIKMKVQGATSSGSDDAGNIYTANIERAKYIAFYLLGQYQIVMEAAHDLNEIVGDMNDEGDEDSDNDEDDEDEDDN
jgi:hypothetical protein